MSATSYFFLPLLALWHMVPVVGQSDSLRFLALGDSYTIGESVQEHERWPMQLCNNLRKKGYHIGDPQIIAKTGWTTDELIKGIAAIDIQSPYDIVSLLIGVNNQYRGRSVEEFRQQYISLLDSAIVYAGGDPSRVFVLSIPDWGAMPFAKDRDTDQIEKEIDLFNDVKAKVTESRGVKFFDITLHSRQAPNNPNLVASDSLHPSAVMYQYWVQQVQPAIVDVLSGK